MIKTTIKYQQIIVIRISQEKGSEFEVLSSFKTYKRLH